MVSAVRAAYNPSYISEKKTKKHKNKQQVSFFYLFIN